METTNSLILPAGDPGLPALTLEMGFIWLVESRIDEVAFVNPQKAPELLTVFNKAFLELTRLMSKLDVEIGAAQRHRNARRSEVILDVAAEVLKAKGLATSKDLREAVVDTDPKYQELQTRLECLEAAKELLKGKAKGIEWAYTSVKKIVGDKPNLGGSNPYNTHSSAERNRPSPTGDEQDRPRIPKSVITVISEPGSASYKPSGGFGKSRY